MTPAEILQQKMAALPEPVLDHLYDERIGDLNERIIQGNGLNPGQAPLLYALLRELFVRDVPFGNLVEEVKDRFNFDDAKAKRLAMDIAGYRLLPLDRWIGDVSGYIRRLGGDVSAYPQERVQLVEKTRGEAASEVVSAASQAAASLRVKERMRDAVSSYLAGVRTEDQVLEVLTRAEKIGGVGLGPQDAKRVVDEARTEARAVIIKEDATIGAPAPSPEPAVSGDAEAAPSAPPDDFRTIRPEDEKEIELVKEVVLPSKGAVRADETAERIGEAIEEIYEASGLKTGDEEFAKRVKTVIGNRLRDVRDQMETLETLVQPKELGGLGLGQDAARALLGAMQESLRAVHEAHAAKIREEKAGWVEAERQKASEAPIKEAAAQETDLERLYRSIVAKSKKATRKAAVAPDAGPPVIAPPSKPSIGAPPNLPVNVTNPVPPEHRAPETVPPAPPGPIAAARTVVPLPPPLTLVRPVPGAPVAAPAGVPGLGPAGRPKMVDVKAAPKLTGPVEELRAITVVDFRRLSKDPKEACLKVRDKIDLLAEQSFTRRTEGIAAWSASEVVRTYLELMREGLDGTPIAEAVAARQAARKPYLTPEEFQAVSELSRQLRY